MIESSDHSPVKRLRLRVLVAAAAATVGAMAAVGSWVRPTPPLPLVAVWGDRLHTPLVPNNLAASNDRAALLDSGCFRAETIQLAAESNGVLTDASPDDARVVYVNAYATRDADGQVLLMTEEFDPVLGTGGLPLQHVLDRLGRQRAPALVVLDLSWRLAEGRAGLAPCGVDAAVHEHLRNNPAPGRLTLVSCSPGETPGKLVAPRRTTFGYFFEAGLRGAADGFNPTGVTDGRVSAAELSRYVVDRVAAWTRAYGPTRQTPVLYGDDACDFVVGPRHATPDPPELQTEPDAYPEWLRSAWDDVAAWNAGLAAGVAPRSIRRLEVELLDAERLWRWTGDSDLARGRFESNSRTPKREITEALGAVADPVCISAAGLAGQPDPDLVSAWLLRFGAAGEPKTEEAFAAQVKQADGLAAARAAIAALERTGDGFREALGVVARLDRARSASPRLVEMAAIRQLADVAASQPEAAEAWLMASYRGVLLRERVLAVTTRVPWFEGPIRQACGLQQSAWAALMSPGYAGPTDVDRLNTGARQAFADLETQLRVVNGAESVVGRALRVLPDLTALVRVEPTYGDAWRRARTTTQRLCVALAESAKPDAVALDRMGRQTVALRETLDRLMAPFAEPAVAASAERVRSNDAASLLHAEAMLTTPLLGAGGRAALIAALNHNANQLARPLYACAYRGLRPQPPPSDGAATTAPVTGQREWELTRGVLSLAGFDFSTDSPDASSQDQQLEPLARVRSALQKVGEEDLAGWSPTRLNQAARALPGYPFQRVLDDPHGAPTLRNHQATTRAYRDLRGGLLRQAAVDVGGGEAIAALARRLGSAPLSPVVTITAVDSSGSPTECTSALSPATPHDVVRLRADGETPMRVDVMTPTSSVEVTPQTTADGDGADIELALRLQDRAPVDELLRTRGLLVRVKTDQGVRHLRVPTPGLAGTSPVRLYVEIAGARLPWGERLALPPTDEGDELRLVVANRSDEPIELTADVAAGADFRASLAVRANSEAALPLKPAAKPAKDPWVDASTLGVVLRDAQRTLFDSTARLSVADPGDYVRVRDARVTVGEGNTPTLRLVVERLPGAPDPVRMIWLPRAERGGIDPVVLGGSLAAELTSDRPVSRIAAKLRLAPANSGRLLAAARVNGVEDTLVWRSGSSVGVRGATLTQAVVPEVRLHADKLVAAGDPLAYSVEAFGAPRGSRLELSLEPLGAEASLGFGERQQLDSPRRGVVSVAPAPGGVGLTARCALRPWEAAFDTAGHVGRRRVVARLIDADKNEIARAELPTTIDGDPPEGASLVAESRVIVGKPAAFRIDGADTLSDVAGVRVYFGLPDGQKPPADAKPIVAKRAGSGWAAKAPVPPEPGELVVTAELTNGVGLSSTVSVPFTALDPEQASLGRVVGRVSEASRPQPGLPVELVDQKRQVVATAKTDPSGVFRFTGLQPGAYQVLAVKPASQRTGATPVRVEAGAETRANVRLTL